MKPFFVPVLFCILLCACARKITECRGLPLLKVSDFSLEVNKGGKNTITVMYTGCGGLIIKAGDEVLLTDPYYTDHDLRKVIFGRIKPDKENFEYVKSILDENNISLDKVKGVLVSHSHYDHMEDLPWMLKSGTLPRDVPILASTTASSIARGCITAKQFINADDSMYGPNRSGSGKWINFGTVFRVKPILSEHSPHWYGVHQMRCCKVTNCTPNVKHACEGRRSFACKWKEGSTYTYLIEINQGDRKLKIFLQPTASSATVGFPPSGEKENIDLAFLAMASHRYVERYPAAIDSFIHAKKTVVIHWENFFDEFYRKIPKAVAFTNPKTYYNKLICARNVSDIRDLIGEFVMPKPGTVMIVKY